VKLADIISFAITNIPFKSNLIKYYGDSFMRKIMSRSSIYGNTFVNTSVVIFKKSLTLVWNCNLFFLFHVLQVRCSWPVHAFGWCWLVTDWCCPFILRSQGLLMLSMYLHVMRLLQCDNVVNSWMHWSYIIALLIVFG
jgi:hypothetical protein